MTPFAQLHRHFCANAPELGDPPNVARLVRIVGDPSHNAAAATYRKYLRGDSVPDVATLQGYARRWNDSGRPPVEVVVEVRAVPVEHECDDSCGFSTCPVFQAYAAEPR